MTDVKFSELTPAAASTLAFVPAINSTPDNFLVAINNVNGLVITDSSGNILPPSDETHDVGSNSFRLRAVNLALSGVILWNDGAGAGSQLSYQPGVGPQVYDNTTTRNWFINLQLFTDDHTHTAPDVSGTLAVLSDVETFTPSTGDTVTPNAQGAPTNIFIKPSGTLAALTLALPAAGLFPNQQLWVTFTSIITALTVTPTPGHNGLAAPTAATANQTMAFAWDVGNTAWQRFL